MKVSVEKLEKSRVKLEIEVEASRFEKGMEFAYKKNARHFFVDGFRKGRVPRKIVERYYGESVFFEDAFEYIYEEVFEEILEETELAVYDRPSLDIITIGEGRDLVFTMEFTTTPDFELGNYKGIEIEDRKIVVTDGDVDEVLNNAAENNARLISVEDGAIENGHLVVIDYQGFIDGEEEDELTGESFELEIGKDKLIDGFDEQLIGAKKGDELEVKSVAPEDFGEEYEGKEILFKVVVNEIKEKELPVIDDEFAMDVSEFDTLEEYRKSIYEDILKSREMEEKDRKEEEILEKITHDTQMEVPEIIINKRVDEMIYERVGGTASNYGVEFEDYLELMGQNIDIFREILRPEAEKEVKNFFVLERIKKIEGIEVTDEDFNAEIEKVMGDADETRKIEFIDNLSDYQVDNIKESIGISKAIDFLMKEAILTEEIEEV